MVKNNAINFEVTSSNSPNTIVERDGSGNFSAGTITATFVGNITGAATQATHVATTTNASFYPLLVSSSANGSNIFNLAAVFSVNASTGLVQTGNVNSSSLTASRIIFTDGSKTYTSSPPAVPQSVMLTNQTSYTANGVLFQNAAGNAFSTASSLTFNGADSFLLNSGNASSEIVCKNTNSGGGAESRMVIDRGNAGSGNSGYAQLAYRTNGATVWEAGMRDAVTDYTIRGGSANRLTLTTGGTLTINGGPFVQGNFADADKFLLLGSANGAKISHSLGWIFNMYAGAFTSIGGGASTGQFSWNTVNGTGSAFSQVMNLSNTGVLNISSLTANRAVSTDGSKNLVSIAAGTAGQVLTSNGSGSAPTFQTASLPSTTCAFSAYLSTASTNATGDGTLVDVICDTEYFDIGSNYDNTTGIFTAPSTGLYEFGVSIFLSNLGALFTQYLMYIVANGVTYMMSQGNPANERSSASNQMTRRGTLLVQLSASQTVKMQVEVDGSTKTVTIGNGGQPTSFWGRLVG